MLSMQYHRLKVRSALFAADTFGRPVQNNVIEPFHQMVATSSDKIIKIILSSLWQTSVRFIWYIYIYLNTYSWLILHHEWKMGPKPRRGRFLHKWPWWWEKRYFKVFFIFTCSFLKWGALNTKCSNFVPKFALIQGFHIFFGVHNYPATQVLSEVRHRNMGIYSRLRALCRVETGLSDGTN